MNPDASSQPVQPATSVVQVSVAQVVQSTPPPVIQAPSIPVNQVPQPAVRVNIPSRPTYRLSAVLIDGGIILALWSAVCLLMAFILNIHVLVKDANNSPLVTMYSLLGGLISIAYYTYFHARDGATPGKKIYGLRVIDIATSSKLPYSKALVRELIKSGIGMVPLVGGLLNLLNGGLVVLSKTKQGLHDSLVKSQVIEVEKPISLWKQLLIYILLLIFWAVSLLLLIVFVFNIGPK